MPLSALRFRDQDIASTTLQGHLPASTLDDPRGNAHGGRPRRHVSYNYRVGTDLGVLSNPQLPDDLGAGAYVDVAFESRYTAGRLPDRDLVK